MKKIGFLCLCLLYLPAHASLRGDCPSYEAMYGNDTLYDLTSHPVLELVKEDMEKSNLLGNIPSSFATPNGIEKLYYHCPWVYINLDKEGKLS